MDPFAIIQTYYSHGSQAYGILVDHSKLVTQKAIEVAQRVPELSPDLSFIREAAMLHDIGMIFTWRDWIYCYGTPEKMRGSGISFSHVPEAEEGRIPYKHHGWIGHDLLVHEGLPRHALVCERHTATGLRLEDALSGGLAPRSMMPESIEEEIICFADTFYTKKTGKLYTPRTIEECCQNLVEKGFPHKAEEFKAMCKKFNEEPYGI